MTWSVLPSVNATLNFLSAVFLMMGYVQIRRGNIALHRLSMVAALGCSSLFLISYLSYHAHIGSKHFPGTGWIRPVYFSILITHTILAAAILPLIGRSLWFAWRADFVRHRAWARVTWPLWMYVSVTGVVIYWMLYRVSY